MTATEVHTLTGAYVLDAVTDLERAAFTRHLGECPACAGEVIEFRGTAARLAAVMTASPATRLRIRVLTEITVTRQLPPVIRSGREERRPWCTRAAVALAAVAAAAVVLVAGIGIGALQTAPAPAAQIAQLAPDTHAVRVSGAAGGTVAVSFSRQRGEAVVTAQGLPALGDNHAYQVWLIGPRGAQSAGLLHTGSGTVTTVLPADADRIGITTEPATGSPQPTTPAVGRVPLVVR
ncbi:anti-sigma factor domain-containing protein [Amycolatopsis sp. cmx-4-61]|uniref:anti-sigma factor n=1 Tax=Amycolatopsis sp. cmx-4-61 TaxID=2790937 RepID=UPI00397C9738